MAVESTYGLKDRRKANKMSFNIADSLNRRFTSMNESANTENTLDKSRKLIVENYNNHKANRNNIIANNQLLISTQNDIYCEAFTNIIEKSIIINEEKKSLLNEYIKSRTKDIYNEMVSSKLLHSEGTEEYDSYLKPFVMCSRDMESIIKDYDGQTIRSDIKSKLKDALLTCKNRAECNKECEEPLIKELTERVCDTIMKEKELTVNRNSLMEECKGFNGHTLFNSLNYYHYKYLKNEESELNSLNDEDDVENKDEIRNEKKPKCCSEGFESLEEKAFCRTIVDYTILEGFNAFNLCDFNNEDVKTISKKLFEKADALSEVNLK